MTDIVDQLRNIGCDREPFTPEHAKCQCRTCNAAADEIERLRSDLALLVPVSLPASQMEQCGYCYTLCAETWKHCPNCGAQARIADRSVRHSKPMSK